MRKFIVLIFVVCVCMSCNLSDYQLERMGDSVRSHIKYRDQEKGTITKIEYLKALSYDEIPEDKRETPEDAYLCKVYVRGTSSYSGSYRVFNIDDTLNYIFNKKKAVLRIDEPKH